MNVSKWVSRFRINVFDWLQSARNTIRWVGVAVSLVSVGFATLSYVGFWSYVRGDDLLEALASRLDTSYAQNVSRQVRPGDPEWRPLIRVITRYTTAHLRADKLPVVFARGRAILSAPPYEGSEWTAPTTPIFLLYHELPFPSYRNEQREIVRVGTLSDLHRWIRKDKDDFNFFGEH